jgi:hypothetical protein
MLEDTPEEKEDARRRAAKRKVLRFVLQRGGYPAIAHSEIINALTERQIDEMLNLTGGNNFHEVYNNVE